MGLAAMFTGSNDLFATIVIVGIILAVLMNGLPSSFTCSITKMLVLFVYPTSGPFQ